LKLVVECAPLAEAAYVDRDMWEKIVLNLLSNAFKFTFEGEIAVVLRRDGAALELSVRDTGTGIPAGELPYLFERFHRVTGARGRTHEGTGIGLAFVRELAKLHGGTVRVDSVEGRGSTFTVSIPAGKAHLPADRIGSERTLASTSLSAEAFTEEALRWLPGAADAAPKRAVSGQRILIADDNADLREYLQRLLGSQYQVEAVADGEAALALARQRRPDLVLTDVMMPRLDGFGLIRELRSDPDLHAVPVIVLSARAGEESRLEGLEKGADDYLLKPFSAGELLGRVGAFLRSAEARREALEQERLAAEQTRRNEQELSDFFDNATVAMHWVGPDGTILRANKAELNLLGYNREEYVGRHIAEFHVDRPAIDDILARLTRGENVHERPVRLRCKDGSIREVVINSSGLFENGRFIHSRCFTQDLTERNLTTQALARLAAIVESSDDAIIGKNLDGIITSWNRSAERLFGYTAQEAIGRPVTMLMPPEQVNEEPGILERIRRGDRMDHYETVRRRKDGMLLDISLSVSPILAGDGKVIGASKIARDITERKRTEAALRDDERRKEEFLAMVSHELRNPLAPIRNAVTLLQQVDDDAEIRRQAIAILDRQIEHMTRLVEELLDLSRIGGGAIEVRKQEVDLAAIVQTALEISRPLVEAGRHQLDVTLPGTPVSIVADRVRMAQVVSNLLNNAAKYTPRGGRIGLNVSTAPDAAAISVRDNGIGIAAGDLPKLFRMFTQLEGARLRSPGGMGVGLALARQLVELHGGTIEARSEGPGRGSEFTVRIPLTAADRPGTSTQTI
jgi:PAS domain S-box-containing protein